MEAYCTIKGKSEAAVEEKRSRFLAQLTPIKTEEEARALLESIRRAHHAARHHVYAWRLQNGGERCSDDGEPAQTAGLPVLAVLRHAQITDAALVVTRYFGGTLLGTGGLQRAYTAAAEAALAQAEIVTYTACVRITLHAPYALEQKLRYLAQQAGAREETAAYAQEVSLSFVLPQEKAAGLANAMREILRGASVEQSAPFHLLFGRQEI